MYELNTSYPPHWINFISVVESSPDIKRVVDVGCGAGVYHNLCEKLKVEYVGYDYSRDAIEIAESTWGGNFNCLDYKDLTEEHILDTDLVVANALFDVLPNGNEALETLLKLKPKRLLAQRVRLTENDSYFEEYSAYDIMTYKFFHDSDELFGTIKANNYSFEYVNLYENVFDLELIRN
jgi:trans-aconitate methyltransferase